MNEFIFYGCLIAGTLSLGIYFLLRIISKDSLYDYVSFFSLLGHFVVAIFGLFAAAAIILVCSYGLGVFKVLAILYITATIWLEASIFVNPIRNLVGDALYLPRCYGCGESHLFRKDIGIPVNDGGASILVCHKCGKDPFRMKPVRAYARLIRTGIGKEAAYRLENSIVAYQKSHA